MNNSRFNFLAVFFFILSGLWEINLYAQPSKAKRLVLSIGISNYKDSYWTPLRFSHKDANDVVKFFQTESEPRFDWTKAITTDPDSDTKYITKQNIEEAFDELSRQNLSEKDIVVVYLSTHGTIDFKNGKLERFIVSSDTDSKNIPETSMAYNDLIKRFRSLKSKKRALILDYCHSGTGKSVLTPEMLLEMEKRKGAYYPEIESDEVEGEYILAASNWRQSAQESSRLENGVYTHFLIKGFKKDLNKDGAVSLTEAHSFARAATYTFTSMEQTPTAKINLEGTDPIFITGERRDSKSAYLFSFIKEFADFRVIIDGKDKGILKKGIAVPAGKVRLKFVNPDTNEVKIDQVVRFRGGAEYSVLNILAIYKKNHFDMGAFYVDYLDSKVRKGHAPKASTGVGFRFSRKNFWQIYDFHLYGSQVNSLEKIGLLEQDRRTYDFAFALGIREDLSVLSPSKKLVRSEFYTNIGPALRYIEVQSDAIKRAEETVVYGARGAVGINLLVPVLNLRTGIEASLSGYQSPFEGINEAVLSSQGFIYLGFQW